jgi:hypothetical protein
MASPRDSKEIIDKIKNGEVKTKGSPKKETVKEKIAKIPKEPKQAKTGTLEGKIKLVKPKKESKRSVIGDASKTLECSVCHKVKPMTSEYFWIYRDSRKGPKLEDNIYWQGPKSSKETKTIGCKCCYKEYRKKLLSNQKKRTKTPTPKPEAKKNLAT